MRREMGAAASSARGWAGTGRRGAHMGASVVVELRRVHELMSGQEAEDFLHGVLIQKLGVTIPARKESCALLSATDGNIDPFGDE